MPDARALLAELMATLTPEQLVAFVEWQAAQAAETAARAAAKPTLTPRQEANARHYQRRKAGLTGTDPKTVSDRIKTIKTDSDPSKTLSDG